MSVASVAGRASAAALAVAGWIASATAAGATATFACTGAAGGFAVSAMVSLGSASAAHIGSARGEVTIKTRAVPDDLRAIAFEGEDLVHHWFADGYGNLHFYRARDETQPFGTVDLVISTRKPAKTQDRYVGRFRLKVAFMRKDGDAAPVEFMATGPVSCTEG